MKRRALVLFSLLALVLVMTGCTIMENFDITISKDGTVEEGITMAFDNKTIDQMIASNAGETEEKTYSDKERWEFVESSFEDSDFSKKEGFKSERFESGEFKGKTFVGKIGTLEKLSTDKEIESIDLSTVDENTKLFTVKDGVYTFSTQLNSEPEEEKTESDTIDIDPSALADALIVNITMKLPYPAISHNAVKVSEDKLTYTWDMTSKDINISFKMEEPKEEAKVEETKVEEPVEEEVKPVWEKASKWAIEELTKANKANLIPTVLEGTDFTQNITRKEFAHVAVKLYEALTNTKAETALSNPFTDTDDVEILKAYNLEITKGTTETTFAPDTLITREQMAAMMTRALSAAKIDVTVDMDAFEHFADDATISKYAKEPVYFMAGKDIIKGVGNKNFDAKGNATREAALLVAVRSCETFYGTNVPKEEQEGTAGSKMPLKDRADDAKYEIQVAMQYLLEEAYGDEVFDARFRDIKVYDVETEKKNGLDLKMDEVAFEIEYELKPSAKVKDVNKFTAGTGTYDEESGWITEKFNLGILRPNEDKTSEQKYVITDFGTGW